MVESEDANDGPPSGTEVPKPYEPIPLEFERLPVEESLKRSRQFLASNAQTTQHPLLLVRTSSA